MAKFGLMHQNNKDVLQEFEGDWLEFTNDSVLVMAGDGSGHVRAFAVIRLHPGQVVKKISK
jgi:hypothetical protein